VVCGSGFGVQGFGVRDEVLWVSCEGFGVWGLGFGVLGLVFGVWGVWCLGFVGCRVEGVGCGV
jgi:hypothetical protein